MKTTTKEARQNIRQYILDHFDPCGYDFTGPCTFPNVARFILEVHAKEKFYSPEYQSRKGYTNEQVFIDWAQFWSSPHGKKPNIQKQKQRRSNFLHI